MVRSVFLLSLVAFGFLSVRADEPRIHTSRSSQQVLPLPKEEDMFHVVVFADRTGGPASGIKILEQAVVDTNMLDPDLVMTVGDLIDGYNATPAWMEQMKEFRAVMKNLKMPWFPVAGNHDVYWRGPGGPPLEHEANYEKHFGPLWYWFEHKKTGFLVLYTDEGDPDKGTKDYRKADQMQMSAAQLTWLEKSLKEMAHCQQVFVFLHHPRWMERYKASNWDDVHQRLVSAGNVSAVMAGHIHRLHYGGKQDGIEYFALATTGGSMPGTNTGLGYVHHYNLLTIRPKGFNMAVLPVGSAIDPRIYTVSRQEDLNRLKELPLRPEAGALTLSSDGEVDQTLDLVVKNPAKQPIEVMVRIPIVTPGWVLAPDHRHVVLQPGAEGKVSFRIARRATGWENLPEFPRVMATIDYLENNTRISLPERNHYLSYTIGTLPESIDKADKNQVGLFNGSTDSLRVEHEGFSLNPDANLTVEAWVRPGRKQKEAALVSKSENSEFYLGLKEGKPLFQLMRAGKAILVEGPESLASGRWAHLAAVADASEVRLYVDGRQVGRTEGKGARTVNELPLYIGADPNRYGNASRRFQGALDEVRISSVARYKGDTFTVSSGSEADKETVLSYSFEESLGTFYLNGAGGRKAGHAFALGSVRSSEEEVLGTD